MLVHYHPPKTAGTSLKDALRAWYSLELESQHSTDDLRKFLKKRDVCVSGHFGMNLSKGARALLSIYPEIKNAPKYKVITAVRDPIDHLISLYYHELAAKKIDPQPLEVFAQSSRYRTFRSYFRITSNTVAKRAIRSFFTVFVTEEPECSMALLSDALGMPGIELRLRNVGARDDQMFNLTRRRRANLEQMLNLEYEFYERARDNLTAKRINDEKARTDQFSYTDIKRRPPPLRSIELVTPDGEAAMTEPRSKDIASILLSQKDKQIIEAKELARDYKITAERLETDLMKKAQEAEFLKGRLKDQAKLREALSNSFKDKVNSLRASMSERSDYFTKNLDQKRKVLSKQHQKIAMLRTTLQALLAERQSLIDNAKEGMEVQRETVASYKNLTKKLQQKTAALRQTCEQYDTRLHEIASSARNRELFLQEVLAEFKEVSEKLHSKVGALRAAIEGRDRTINELQETSEKYENKLSEQSSFTRSRELELQRAASEYKKMSIKLQEKVASLRAVVEARDKMIVTLNTSIESGVIKLKAARLSASDQAAKTQILLKTVRYLPAESSPVSRHCARASLRSSGRYRKSAGLFGVNRCRKLTPYWSDRHRKMTP